MTWHNLRQQTKKAGRHPELLSRRLHRAEKYRGGDYIGTFAVTTGIGIEKRIAEFEKQHDDYNAILLKALADRLAEAFAEHLHLRVRREFLGLAADEGLDNDALIAEKYRGIRPAPGYPACPEHSEKGPCSNCCKRRSTRGITLTDSYAMLPTAAVSGFYFSHPLAQYFATGKVDRIRWKTMHSARLECGRGGEVAGSGIKFLVIPHYESLMEQSKASFLPLA